MTFLPTSLVEFGWINLLTNRYSCHRDSSWQLLCLAQTWQKVPAAGCQDAGDSCADKVAMEPTTKRKKREDLHRSQSIRHRIPWIPWIPWDLHQPRGYHQSSARWQYIPSLEIECGRGLTSSKDCPVIVPGAEGLSMSSGNHGEPWFQVGKEVQKEDKI